MYLSTQSLLVIIVVGIVAGYLAGRVMQGGGFGLIGDLVVGLIGAFIGDWLLPRLGIHLGVGNHCPNHQRLHRRCRSLADPSLSQWRRLGLPQAVVTGLTKLCIRRNATDASGRSFAVRRNFARCATINRKPRVSLRLIRITSNGHNS